MRTLIIQLPADMPNVHTQYPHTLVQGAAEVSSISIKWATHDLLPSIDRKTEVVALLPATATSWHKVTLPPGLQKQPARCLQALQGLLEDRLLSDPTHLHFALQSGWKNTPHPWVAVCDRVWLEDHLRVLEKANLTVHRIVPELSPDSTLNVNNHCKIIALGEGDTGWIWVTHYDQGVYGYPMRSLLAQPEALGLSNKDLQDIAIQAEPGVVELTGQILNVTPQLIPPGQHWKTAVAGSWDLAQFHLRATTLSRQVKTLQRAISNFKYGPSWRPVRWGVLTLLACQMIGLNAWAWKTRANWQIQQQNLSHLLRETFPKTTVVIDAPMQMAREVEQLRQASGQLSATDLEAMLSALGKAMPEGIPSPGQWHYQPGQLRLKNFKPNQVAQQVLQTSLQAHGYKWTAQGDDWLVSIGSFKPTTP
jgi:general secretion pathway protein L